MTKTIYSIKKQIRQCKRFNQNLDECSWGYQVGVLLTANEAQEIIDFYNTHKK